MSILCDERLLRATMIVIGSLFIFLIGIGSGPGCLGPEDSGSVADSAQAPWLEEEFRAGYNQDTSIADLCRFWFKQNNPDDDKQADSFCQSNFFGQATDKRRERLETLSSPLRLAQEPIQTKIKNYLDQLGQQLRITLHLGSALDLADSYEGQDFGHVPLIARKEWIDERFRYIRDTRFSPIPGFDQDVRRITWLYPDDGCFYRAAMVNRLLGERLYQRLAKIFVFGNLTVETANHPSGRVYWWYHVAPIVSDGNERFVYDPAIEPERPIALYSWLSRMGVNEKTVTISICNSYAYIPISSCRHSFFLAEQTAPATMLTFLPKERDRLIQLGRDPEIELGDYPPWTEPQLLPPDRVSSLQ